MDTTLVYMCFWVLTSRCLRGADSRLASLDFKRFGVSVVLIYDFRLGTVFGSLTCRMGLGMCTL